MTFLFSAVLVAATVLVSLVTGLLFGFAQITMPGIHKLGDREFIRAFQVMDGIIQRNDPLFMVVWVGSALLLLLSVVLASPALSPALRAVLVAATAVYFLGLQIPTVAVNVPLNNELQAVDAEAADPSMVKIARRRFEARWNRWNRIRTVVGISTTTMLVTVLYLARIS